MAISENILCDKCGEKRMIMKQPGTVVSTCHLCQSQVFADKKRAHFDRLDGMTVEERLREIEEWIYNYSPPVRPGDILY